MSAAIRLNNSCGHCLGAGCTHCGNRGSFNERRAQATARLREAQRILGVADMKCQHVERERTLAILRTGNDPYRGCHHD
jgi:hypothetical protein